MWLLPLLLLLVTAASSCELPCRCYMQRMIQRDSYFYIRFITSTIANCSDGSLTAPPELNAINIIKLILAHNNIKALDSYSFTILGYEDIIFLDLSNNQISSVHTHTFTDMPYIKEINLSNNRLSYLPTDVFLMSKELTSLYLSGNPLILPTDAPFLNSPSLEFLIMSNCNLSTIYLESFKDMPLIHSLDISENTLGVVNVSALLSLERLIQLDIYGNPNLQLEGKDSLSLSTLMMGNSCSWLKNKDAFLGIPTAHQIHLDSCALEQFPATALSTATLILFLDLSNNKISNWNESSDVIKNLIRINLHGNKISNLDKDAFTSSPSLAYLNISNNPIDVERDGSFLNIPVLLNLDMRNCSVTQLTNLTFSNMINLKEIDLSNNKIKKINENTFTRLRNLTKVLLADNGLQSLDRKIFVENFELEILDLSLNPLLVPATNDSLLVSNSLQIIFLREMNITKFAHLLHNMFNLSSVDVSGNNISTIELSDINVMQKLVHVVLNKNPLICDAKMQKVYLWTKQQNISVEGNCLHPKGTWLLLEHLHFSENETIVQTGEDKQNSEDNSQASASVQDSLSTNNSADTNSGGVGGGSVAAILIAGVIIGIIVGGVLMVLFGKRFFIYGGFASVRLHNVDSPDD